jgi:hypothetical protein
MEILNLNLIACLEPAPEYAAHLRDRNNTIAIVGGVARPLGTTKFSRYVRNDYRCRHTIVQPPGFIYELSGLVSKDIHTKVSVPRHNAIGGTPTAKNATMFLT